MIFQTDWVGGGGLMERGALYKIRLPKGGLVREEA